MNKSLKATIEFVESRWKVLVAPFVVFTVLSVGYAIIRPSTWEATQALYTRDESFGALTRGGRFESTDAMQAAQETIYEIAHHPEVLATALKEVGPPKRKKRGYPSAHDIKGFRSKVSINAPQGAKFGRTEVIYVSVRDHDKQRAVELADAMTESLLNRMKRLRIDRYSSIVAETERGVTLARTELAKASRNLTKIEKSFGHDLAELRSLMSQNGGQGNVQRAIAEVEGELRRAQNESTRLMNQKKQLTAAINDPRRLINMPSEELNNQPTLRRLKEGLVDAQLRANRLMGVKSARHPDVIAAVNAVEGTRRQLHRELALAIKGLDSQVVQAQNRVSSLKRQQELANGRMGGLAAVRTQYSNLASEVKQRAEFLEEAQSNLAIARSNMLSAQSISLIHRVESPMLGTDPVGLSRKVIVLAGMMFGALTSCGLAFIMMPIDEKVPDTGFGRRAADRLQPMFGRRATDQPSSNRSVDRRKQDRAATAKAPDGAANVNHRPEVSNAKNPATIDRRIVDILGEGNRTFIPN